MADRQVDGTVVPLKKAESSVNAKVNTRYTEGLRTAPGPSNILLRLDADDRAESNLGITHNNWPDKADNHGELGATMNFTDGRARFVKRQEYLRALNPSQHSNNRPPDGL